MTIPPSEGDPAAITRILRDAKDDGRRASNELLPLVYADLRKLAAARMAKMAPGQTLQATALVHEAYVRLVGRTDPGFEGRAHFFGAAARAMRNVLADHLQQKNSLKRGGNVHHIGASTAALSSEGPSDDVLAVEEALEELERDYPRRAEIVTLRFFGGLSNEEIAEVMDLSTRSVERDWRFARAWLNDRLGEREQT